MDVNDAVAASQKLDEALRASGQIVGDFATRTIEFNKAGEATKAVMEQMDASGRKIVTTFNLLSTNAEVMSQRIVQNANSSKAALEQLQLTVGRLAATDASKIFPVASGASVQSIVQYNAALTNLQRAFAASGASSQQLQSMLTQASQNAAQFATSINNLPPNLQQLANSILNVAQASQISTQANQAYVISWQGLVRIVEVQLFRRAVTATINALRDGIQTAIEYQTRLQQVANVTGQTAPGQFDALRANVRALSEEFARPLGETAGLAQTAITQQAGDASRGLNVLTQAMRLSQATGTDEAASIRLVTTSLDAFRLSADQSSRVAGLFASTAGQTRIPLDQMQNAIGRIGPTAHAMGLSLEQVLALFTTIAQQGGRPTESFTRLNQVLGRFENPTRELQRFMQGLGTPTVQAAVSVYGLTGFLNQLNVAIERSPELLNQFGGSLRSDIALMSVLGDNTRRFEQTLQGLQRVDPTALFTARQRVAETPAAEIQRSMQQLRNIFTEDIGGPLLRITVNVVRGLGGVKTALVGLLEAIASISLTYATYVIASNAASAATFLFSRSSRDAMSSLTGATSTFGVGISRTAAWTAAITIAAGAALALRGAIESMHVAEGERVRTRVGQIGERGQRQQEGIRGETQTGINDFTTLVNQAFAERQREAANAVTLSGDVRDEMVRHHREIAQSWQVQAESFLDTLRNQLSNTRRAISENRADLHSSARESENFGERARAQSFQNQLQASRANPQAQAAIITNRMEEIQLEIQRVNINRNATREEVQGARGRFGELLRLNNEYWSALRSEGAQSWEAVTNAAQGYARTIADPTAREAYIRDIQERARQASVPSNAGRQQQQQSINDLVAQMNAFEQRHRENINASTAALERQQTVQRENLRNFEQQFRLMEQFRVFNEQGRLLPQYQTAEQRQPGGGISQALRDFDLIANRIREMAQTQNNLLPPDQRRDMIALAALLNQRRAAIVAEGQAHTNVNQAVENQRRLQEEINNQIERGTRLLREREAAQLQTSRSSTAFTQTLANIQGALAGGGAGGVIPGRVAQPTTDIARSWNQLRDAIDAADAANRAFNTVGGQTVQNAQALEERAAQLRTALERISQFDQRQLYNAGITPGLATGGAGRNLAENIQSIINNGQAGVGALSQYAREVTGSIRDTERLSLVIQGNTIAMQGAAAPALQLADAFRNAGIAAGLAGPQINAMLTDTERLTISINNQIQQLTQQLNSLRGNAPGGPNFMGPPAPGFAAGGPVGGGPRGTDTLLAWLTPGEYVVDRENTRRFYSQLVSISHGIQPRYYASGGMVTVGDININVQGGETSERTVRDIGRSLNRELKRGTIAFQTLQEK